jgi:hypothetical protein
MTPRKLNIYFGFPSYGGNGGISSEVPDIRRWFTETILACKADPRVGDIIEETVANTPITMVRNRFVVNARKAKADILVMIDSDQSPQLHKDDPGFKPFFASSFDFLYKHYDKGPVAIGAPYCGPPPHENVYVFRWDNDHYAGDETPFRLEQFTRYEAATMRGISEVAALPTGLIMYDMRCFDITEPSKLSKEEVLDRFKEGTFDRDRAIRELSEGWFYYEWENGWAAEKASTEDVTQTRDLSLSGMATLGYNPVYCNWDSPIGHWKPWCVKGRPLMFGVEHIGASFKRAVEQKREMSTVEEFKSGIDLSGRLIHKHFVNADGKFANGNGKLEVGMPNGKHTDEPSKDEPIWVMETPIEHLQGLADIAKYVAGELGRAPQAVEIGSWHGSTAKALVKGGAKVLCVDTWKGSPTDWTGYMAKQQDPYMQFCQNTVYERENDLIDTWVTDSLDAARRMRSGARRVEGFSGPFDIIFIDADHSYESTKADILAWLEHLAPDGVMLGHDFNTIQFPGVTQAVAEIFGDKAKSYCHTEKGGMWMVSAKDIPHLLQEPAGVC